jgi:hypothetical protein
MKNKYVLIIAVLTMFSCQVKKKESTFYTIGVLRDRTGLDGCSWIIQLNQKLNDGTEFLEPINLMDFVKQPSEGFTIHFTFEKAAAMSVCMAGQPVNLTDLR